MKCKCSKLPDYFYLENAPWHFEKNLNIEDYKDWMKLGSCHKCGQLWAVDEWDKYSHQMVSKISSRQGWEKGESIELRKQLLLKNRGGVTEQACILAGCGKKAVKDVVYCIDHLYETGATK